MELNKVYSERELSHLGMEGRTYEHFDFMIFSGKDKVYFFDQEADGRLRLYTVISSRSFFLR